MEYILYVFLLIALNNLQLLPFNINSNEINIIVKFYLLDNYQIYSFYIILILINKLFLLNYFYKK